jgi:hypothetical protein
MEFLLRDMVGILSMKALSYCNSANASSGGLMMAYNYLKPLVSPGCATVFI